MELTECPNCLTQMTPTTQGQCPSCRLSASDRGAESVSWRYLSTQRPHSGRTLFARLMHVLFVFGCGIILIKSAYLVVVLLQYDHFGSNARRNWWLFALLVLMATKGSFLFVILCRLLASSIAMLATAEPDSRKFPRLRYFPLISGPAEYSAIFCVAAGGSGAACCYVGSWLVASLRSHEMLLHIILPINMSVGVLGAWFYRLSVRQRLLTEQSHVTQQRSPLYSTPLVMCLAAIWASPLPAAPPARQEFSAIQSFQSAADPYSKAAYDREGYVDRSGVIHGNGLGCSAYVSVVLHRMRDGADWKTSYDLKVHQGYGDSIAAHFGLQKAASVSAVTLCDARAVQELQSDQTLRTGTLYLFNVRRNEQGHVGFVRVNSNGTLTQWHYSGLKAINGLAAGNFADWLSVSQYRDSDVDLYPVPEPISK